MQIGFSSRCDLAIAGKIRSSAAVNDDAIRSAMTFQCFADETFVSRQVTLLAEEELARAMTSHKTHLASPRLKRRYRHGTQMTGPVRLLLA
jgi:hypothetical protein